MKTVYLSLGSNIGDRESTLQAAVNQLHSPQLRILRVSPVYETEPVGFRNQNWFLNLVVEAETELFPLQLLSRIRKVEKHLGRKRTIPQGPRTIDIDIVLFGNFIVHTPSLDIPHPRFAERRFVLAPIAELAPDLRDPVSRRTIRELLPETAGQSVRRIEFRPTIP